MFGGWALVGVSKAFEFSVSATAVAVADAAPVASAVVITGTAKVGVQLSGGYTYTDANGDPQGTSTFRWVSNTVNTGVTGGTNVAATQNYTPVSGDQGKYLYFCVTPVASSGTSPGAEVCSSASAAVAVANSAPSFVAPGLGSLTVAPNASATDIKALLHARDSDAGQTLTWTQNSAPSHGALSFANAAAASGSTDITPGGSITYTPTAGYSGSDSFSVQVSDGLASATRTIGVAVQALAQVISAIEFNPANLAVGGITAASATATSGLSVIFSSLTPTICIVSGSSVTGLLAGTCTVEANQAGNAIYAPAAPVSKNITVEPPPLAVVALSPSSLSFDEQHLGTTSPTQAITLTNTGGSALAITSILPTISVFTVSHNCGTSLAAAASCKLDVSFTPDAEGTRVSAITVSSNAIGSPHIVTVSGVGVASNSPICALSAAPSSVRKNGTSTLTANCSPAVTSYSWTGGTCAGTTASTCTVTPTVTTTYTVTGTNNFGSSTASVAVTVKKVDLTPILMLLLE